MLTHFIDVLKSLDGDFARMMKEIHSLRENVTILETETEELKRDKSMWEEIKAALAERLNSYNAQINMFTLVILCDQFALQKSALLAKKR
uniref:Uncharacterized protein n=1 Tax=Glossina austeni TaxID=7395 RepID=A0A1A9UN11_GLOAU